MSSLHDEISRVLLQRHQSGGTTCRCCEQHAQVYRRTINAQMARALILLYRTADTTHWTHWRSLVGRARADEAKLRFWGLVEESSAVREDGGRAGYWRCTATGMRFAKGLIQVPRVALIYNNQCIGFDDEQRISIQDALGQSFNYRELLTGPMAPHRDESERP